GRNYLAVVIRKFECRGLRTDGQSTFREMPGLQFRDSLRMNRLGLSRNVLGNQFFALGKDLAQRSRVSNRTGFFERTPLHSRSAAQLAGILRLRCASLREPQLRSQDDMRLRLRTTEY